jgi:hypothetical protein
MARSRGRKNHVTPEQRSRILKIRAENPGLTFRILAERFGVSTDVVAKLVRDACAGVKTSPKGI